MPDHGVLGVLSAMVLMSVCPQEESSTALCSL